MVTAATEKRRAAQKARLIELGIEQIEKPRTGRNKFHATAAIYNGERYDSAGEAEYARKLDLMVVAGEVTDWERPSAIAISPCLTCRATTWEACRSPKGVAMTGTHRDRVTYKPDFYIVGAKPTEFGALKPMPTGYYVDYKGGHITETPLWRLKIKYWRVFVPWELRVAYADGTERVVATGAEVFMER